MNSSDDFDEITQILPWNFPASEYSFEIRVLEQAHMLIMLALANFFMTGMYSSK